MLSRSADQEVHVTTAEMTVVAHAMTAEAQETTGAVTAVTTAVVQEMTAEVHAMTTEAEDHSVQDLLKREPRTSMTTTTMLLISMSLRTPMMKSSRLS